MFLLGKAAWGCGNRCGKVMGRGGDGSGVLTGGNEEFRRRAVAGAAFLGNMAVVQPSLRNLMCE